MGWRGLISGLLLTTVAGGAVLLSCARDEKAPASAQRAAPAPQHEGAAPATQPADPAAVLARGMELYAAQCATCHGPQGLGDGPAAYLLYPKPRDFTQGQFRITSTQTGLPTDADLLQTLRRGMPGSAMPPWGHLPESDLNALVAAVRNLAIEGKVTQLMAKRKTTTREKALVTAHNVLDPGVPIDVPPRPPVEQISMERGKELYLASCSACHGVDGRAKEKGDLKDISGLPIFARDFTQGIFKGSPSDIELARRITGGMPGSPMPSTPLPAADLWSLVGYIQTMIKPGAQERIEQKQTVLAAARVGGAPLPTDPDDPAWQLAKETFLPVMPLWWRDDRIEGVTFAAVHDGTNLAVRLTWDDPSQSELTTKPQWFTDGVAVQLSAAANPPFFGMGGPTGTVSIWHWKASWERDNATGAPSLKDTYPNMPEDEGNHGAPEGPVYQSGLGAGNPLSEMTHGSPVENLAARGQGTLTTQRDVAAPVKGRGRWKAGRWDVVFVRPLATATESEIALDAPQGASIAFAVWDGQQGDRNGQKAVTVWHRLVLENPSKK